MRSRIKIALRQLFEYARDEVGGLVSRRKAENAYRQIFDSLAFDWMLKDWAYYEAWRERLAQADKYWEQRLERLLATRSTCNQPIKRMVPHTRIVVKLYLRDPR